MVTTLHVNEKFHKPGNEEATKIDLRINSCS